MDHPVFKRFRCWTGTVEPGVKANFLGVRTREHYCMFLPQHAGPRHLVTRYVPVCEDYFEYIDVLESVAEARGAFTMIELGAGYGRWLVNAAVALQQLSDIPCHLVGVEAEPTHFEWMQQHFLDNGIDPGRHTLIRAAVAARDGRVRFTVGDPAHCYAQALAANGGSGVEALDEGGVATASTATGEMRTEEVDAISLNTLLEPLARVNLLDLDVQGAELEVLEPAAAALARKVERVHIGTHNRTVETGLRSLFSSLAWHSIHDYGSGSRASTPWGDVDFEDGVQSWLNPRMDRTRAT
jgi:FkbM family methyltransferase